MPRRGRSRRRLPRQRPKRKPTSRTFPSEGSQEGRANPRPSPTHEGVYMVSDQLTPIERVLDRLEGVKAQNGYFMAICPAHDDHDPSLSIEEGDDGRALINCFAGCANESVVEAIGLGMQDLFPENGRGGGGVRPPSGKRKYVNTGEAGCTLAQYADAKRLPTSFLKSLRVGEIPHYNGRPAVRFPYLNAQGEQVCTRFRVSL